MERIYLSKVELENVLQSRRIMDHIERYLNARRFVYGRVLDFGCGVGYGSYLLSQNPDIDKVVGCDIKHLELNNNQDAFLTIPGKLEFMEPHEVKGKFDVLIALEVIEHLKTPQVLLSAVSKADPETLIISFPNKPSTKFNPYHFHDFSEQDVLDIFKGYMAVRRFESKDVTMILFTRAPENMPFDQYRNILSIWE